MKTNRTHTLMHHDVAKYHCFMYSLSIYPYSLDIDECTNPTNCAGHTCFNTPGSYKCICSLGCMNDGADLQTCIGNDNDIINAMK